MNATSSLVYDDYKSFQLTQFVTQMFLIINFTQKCFCIFILYLILCFWFAIDSPKCPKVISIFLAVVWRAATLPPPMFSSDNNNVDSDSRPPHYSFKRR